MTTLRCPLDQEVLTRLDGVLGDGTHGFACTRCGGVLVDWKHGEQFLKSKAVGLDDLQARVARAKKKDGVRPCPACGVQALEGFELEDTELDVCSGCGHLWFDRGELQRLSDGKLGKALPSAPQVKAHERSDVVGVYEMWWDCQYCGTTALLGKSNRFCPQCGGPQDAKRRYFPPEGQETAYNGAYDGVDRNCPACNTPNGAKANNCRHCGSPMDGSKAVATRQDRVKGPPPPASTDAPKGRPTWLYVLAAIAVLGCGFCGLATFWTKPSTATVQGHRWTRAVDIEALTPTSDSAWCDSLPSGAYGVSRHKEQRSTKRIPDGESCSTRDVDKGDGTFERRRECTPKYREEPIYDDRCTFTVDRWQKSRQETAKGDSLSDAPRWPAVRLGRTGHCVGCEREGPRRETYTVLLAGPKGEAWQCDLNEGKWRSLSVGAKKDVKVRVIGNSVDCGSL